MEMRIKKWLLAATCLALIIASPLAGFAASSGARPAALSGAYVGLAEGFEAVYWNPAGLAWLARREAGVGLVPAGLASGQPDWYVGYATPDDGWGAGAIWLNAANDVLPGDGTLATSSFGYSYAKQVTPKIALGGTLRLVTQDASFPGFDLPEARGLGIDVGALWRATDRLSLGLSVRDANGTPMESEAGVEQSPVDLRPGLSWKLNERIRLNLDATDALGNTAAGAGAAAGVEINLNPRIQLRSGLASAGDVMTWSAGLGYGEPTLRLDLGASGDEEAWETVMSVTLAF